MSMNQPSALCHRTVLGHNATAQYPIRLLLPAWTSAELTASTCCWLHQVSGQHRLFEPLGKVWRGSSVIVGGADLLAEAGRCGVTSFQCVLFSDAMLLTT